LDENKYIADNVNRGEGNFNIGLTVIKKCLLCTMSLTSTNLMIKESNK